MPLLVTLDAVLQQREMTGKQLATAVGLSETQLSMFRSGKVRGIRFATLARICDVLHCQPGDLLSHVVDGVGVTPSAGP